LPFFNIFFGLLAVLPSAVASSPDSTKREERAHQLVADVCTSCHDLARVKVQALSKEEWAGLIKGMVSEGAAVSDEEMDLIVDYLARHFGYRAKGAAHSETAKEPAPRSVLREFSNVTKDGKQ
jgi:hypothetical protein